MSQTIGTSPEISSIGFHAETVITILMVLAVIALAGYATLHCLKKGVLCPNVLTRMHPVGTGHRTQDIGHLNFRSLYPDIQQMNSMQLHPMLPPAQRLTVLPGEYVDGRCWAPDNRTTGYGGEPASCPPAHTAPPSVFASPASRPTYVMPKEEKRG
jgi:hypothetical protein